MEETDAVSCLLCLQADEWGSMVKVPIYVLGEQTPSEKVLCRVCSAAVSLRYNQIHEREVKEAQSDELAKPDQGA